MNFRNEKVTAPLKQTFLAGANFNNSNFRNEKVTAPLKPAVEDIFEKIKGIFP